MVFSPQESRMHIRRTSAILWKLVLGKLIAPIVFGVGFSLFLPLFLSIIIHKIDPVYCVILSVSLFVGPVCISTVILFIFSLFVEIKKYIYAKIVDIFIIFPILCIHFHFFFTKSWPIITEEFPLDDVFWTEIGNQATIQILAASGALRLMEYLALFGVRYVLRRGWK